MRTVPRRWVVVLGALLAALTSVLAAGQPAAEASATVATARAATTATATTPRGVTAAQAADTRTAVFRLDGHTVDVFAPKGRVTAVFVLMPGLELSIASLEEHSNLIATARASGWLLAYMSTTAGAWDAGLCCRPATTKHEADAGTVADVATSLRTTYGVSSKVPLILGGFSNGAMMTAEMLCRRPGLAAGAIMMAGGLQDPHCTSARATQMLIVRGLSDHTVPIGGTSYSTYLKTRLMPDTATLAAAERGSHCGAPQSTVKGRATKTVTRCGSGRVTYITEPGTHTWLDGHSSFPTTAEIKALVQRLTHH